MIRFESSRRLRQNQIHFSNQSDFPNTVDTRIAYMVNTGASPKSQQFKIHISLMCRALLVAFLSNLPVVFLEHEEKKMGEASICVYILVGILCSEIQVNTFH